MQVSACTLSYGEGTGEGVGISVGGRAVFSSAQDLCDLDVGVCWSRTVGKGIKFDMLIIL